MTRYSITKCINQYTGLWEDSNLFDILGTVSVTQGSFVVRYIKDLQQMYHQHLLRCIAFSWWTKNMAAPVTEPAVRTHINTSRTFFNCPCMTPSPSLSHSLRLFVSCPWQKYSNHVLALCFICPTLSYWRITWLTPHIGRHVTDLRLSGTFFGKRTMVQPGMIAGRARENNDSCLRSETECSSTQ